MEGEFACFFELFAFRDLASGRKSLVAPLLVFVASQNRSGVIFCFSPANRRARIASNAPREEAQKNIYI